MFEDIFYRTYYEGGAFMGAVFETWPMQFSMVLLQAVLILASFVLLAGVVWLLITSNYYRPKIQKWRWFFEEETEDTEKAFAKTWGDIRARLGESDTEYRELILEATTFMEQVFTTLQYEGDTLHEQLEHIAVSELPNKGDVESAARKARVMREDEEVSAAFQEAEMVIGVYDAALHALGVVH